MSRKIIKNIKRVAIIQYSRLPLNTHCAPKVKLVYFC